MSRNFSHFSKWKTWLKFYLNFSIDYNFTEAFNITRFSAVKIIIDSFRNKFLFFCLTCRLDYCGIAVLIMVSFVPWLYYGFYCYLTTKIVYTSIVLILGIMSVIVSFWEKFSKPELRPVRTGELAQQKQNWLEQVWLIFHCFPMYIFHK